MKKANSHIAVLCLLSFLLGCNPQTGTQSSIESSLLSYSSSYQAPVFTNDKRIEKIQSIASELQELMEQHMQDRNIPGVAYGIVVDNQLVLASSSGMINLESKTPATPQSVFRIASMTKSFTAMAIMKLRDEGKLRLNDPASKYIPEMASLEYLTADAPIIDIQNLLTMTAGFPEDNPWGDRQLDEPESMLLDLIKDGVSFSNASSYGYEYSNTGYALLGSIVGRISGMSYQSYIKENIFQPLGMNDTYWEIDNVPKKQLAIGYRWEDEQWKLEPMLHDGSYGSMGGLITTIEDFSKYVSLHLSAWPPRSSEDNGPVKRGSLREMQTPQFSRLYPNATYFDGEPCAYMSGYGYGLGTAEYCNGLRRVSHGGALPGFGSNYVFFPEYGVGVMAFCNLTYTSPYPFSKIGELLFETLGLEPRELPTSEILIERQKQIADLIQDWDSALESEIMAENFYLDKSHEHRKVEISALLEKAGAMLSVGELEPYNQLRGRFDIETENGFLNVFFTLSPEKAPKVQRLNVSFEQK
ncbi:MAG: serine hydrolase domain-containing protein [Cyclobacteriaceae bacterium]